MPSPVLPESTNTNPGKSSAFQDDTRSIILASNLRVHLIMTEELSPITKQDWEDMPSCMYVDIDKWD